MTLNDLFTNLPPVGIEDSGLKLLLYLLAIYSVITAIVGYYTSKGTKSKSESSLLSFNLGDSDRPIPKDIPADERIAILNIEKAKFQSGQKALTEAKKKKEISDLVFEKLSIRYANDIRTIDESIEETKREVEVSQLEEELKKMQGDYLTKIKGKSTEKAPNSSIPSTPSTTSTSAASPPKPAGTPPGVSPPKPAGTTPPPGITPPPGVSTPKPPTATPKPPTATPSTQTPTPPSDTKSSEGGDDDLFAKSTSIAALRKEMLKELDRLKKFMNEQQ